MKKRVLLLIAPIITLILEALPFGVKMNFATAEGTITRYTSYFDTLPYFYAMFSPLITAVLCCAIFIVLLIYCFWETWVLLIIVKVLLFIAVILSVWHSLFYITLLSVLITLLMVIELVVIKCYTDKT
ncbi:MAG: hypothetical protein IJ433_08945 [Ruminococcus sp.]|nr:hypothetical protein [Ruminococcus sp.]